LRKALLFLITMFSTVFLGVEYVEPPNKVFVDNTYYQGFQSAESPDYRSIYSKVNAASIVSKAESTKDARPLDRGYKPFQPAGDKEFMWLWGLKTSDHYRVDGSLDTASFGFLKEKSTSNTKGYTKTPVGPDLCYLWTLPEGSKLTAFANSYISANEQYIETPYPASGYSKGVNMSLIHIRETDTGQVAYRVTYMSMKRWWVDLDKKGPDQLQDNDDKKPLYGHNLSFSTDDRFYPGSVIGEVGRSGVSSQVQGNVLIARFTSCPATNGIPNGDWAVVDINKFYGLTN